MIPGDQGGGGYQYQLVNMAGGWGTFNDTRPRSAHTFAKNANVWGTRRPATYFFARNIRPLTWSESAGIAEMSFTW